MKAYIVTVGDEILIGQVIDTNSAWLATQLNLIGCSIIGKMSVADERKSILEGLYQAFAKADIVLMTGGLGPTKDDITKKVIAEFFGVGMQFSQETYTRLNRYFERLGRTPLESHRLQCYMPTNVELLTNRMGTAPGMWFRHGQNKVLISMPGVPYEMKHLMTEHVLPKLKTSFIAKPIAHRTLLTAGRGESMIAKDLQDLEEELPDFIKLSYLPNLGGVRLRLTGMMDDPRLLNYHLDNYANQIKKQLEGWVFGEGESSLEARLGASLVEKVLTIGTAESCTGGKIAAKIVRVPGASRYYLGSIVAYSNKLKAQKLQVADTTIKQYGAVSEETVKEMVNNALGALGVDIAIAISGIAGPQGGTKDKPVGTVHLAIGTQARIINIQLTLGKDREKNIEYATNYALFKTWQFVNGYA